MSLKRSSGRTARRKGPRRGAPVPDVRPRRTTDSIIAMLGRARENARGSQETLSGEAWSQVNKLYLYLGEHPGAGSDLLRGARPGSSTRSSGPAPSSTAWSTRLCHGPRAYHFLQIGRYLERVEPGEPDPQRQGLRSCEARTDRRGTELRLVHWSEPPHEAVRPMRPICVRHHDRIDPEESGPLPGPQFRLPRAIRFCALALCL